VIAPFLRFGLDLILERSRNYQGRKFALFSHRTRRLTTGLGTLVWAQITAFDQSRMTDAPVESGPNPFFIRTGP
jgi:hypothetical protein